MTDIAPLLPGGNQRDPTPAMIPGPDGLDLALHDLGGAGPPLLMVHATGIHGWAFRPLAEHLTDSFHCWSLDLRGHGDSPVANDETFEWGGFGRDVSAALAFLEPGPVTGFGHSLGGAALVMAEHDSPGALRQLILYEPALLPPLRSTSSLFLDELSMMVEMAGRRRRTFASQAEAIRNYASKPPMSSWSASALHAYVMHGFAESDDGSVQIKCQPEVEAATFANTQTQESHGAWESLGALGCPAALLVGTMSGGQHLMTAAAAAEQFGVPVEVLEGLEHFGPLQLPAFVAEAINRSASTPPPPEGP
jgi:pimeloyl-ACP methyl ester carboxylesterase